LSITEACFPVKAMILFHPSESYFAAHKGPPIELLFGKVFGAMLSVTGRQQPEKAVALR
jgi:hypothetical protein